MKLLVCLLFACTVAIAQEGPPQEPPFINDVNSEENLDKEFSEFDESVLAEESKSDNGLKVETADSPKISPVIESNISTRLDQKSEPQFVKPPGPKKGGVLKVPHPNAAKGLIRIEKDGSYTYKVGLRPKDKSSSFRFGFMTPPKIQSGTKSYSDYYGEKNINAMTFEYEWQPFQSFGRLGLKLGTGFSTAKGIGYFKRDGTRAEETFTLYTIPASLFLNYRFEYMRRQWLIPYITGGASLFGMAEVRDDNRTRTAMGSAVGGGGGLLFSISAIDNRAAFILDREYGIADLYFCVEAKAMQGLSKEIDFTHQAVNAGFTVDF
jgi:hypothetical protein